IQGEESPEFGDGAGGAFLDELEDGLGEFLVVDPRGWLPHGRREEGLRAALLEAGDVVADRPVRDTVARTVLVTESFAFLQGQLFIGERFDELEDSGAFFETGVRKALPVGFSHAADLLDSGCQRFTAAAPRVECTTDGKVGRVRGQD